MFIRHINLYLCGKETYMEMIEMLRADGAAKGLCREWQGKLRPGVSMERLVRLFVRGIDFCVKNDFPTLDFMRMYFKGKCEAYGAYVDGVCERRNAPAVVLNGNCVARLTYDGYAVSRVVVRHRSDASVTVYGCANVTIDVFDDAVLNLVVTGTRARVLVYRYGNGRVNYGGTYAKIVNKDKNIY